MRSIEFVTLDPPGSMDLDQAMHLERLGNGYRVLYAIADVGAVVPAGGAIEAEAWKRGETVYCPDTRALLYPSSISEGAASLLPDADRPAFLFQIDLDSEGRQIAAQVHRALVRSRHKLTYRYGHVPLLKAIGTLRRRLADERGAVLLNTPAQSVVPDNLQPAGYRLELEQRHPIEDWNAEISLLTGMAAAQMMIAGGLGLLRTMVGIDEYRLARLRRTAQALHVPWPLDVTYPQFIGGLDPTVPAHAVLLQEAHGVMGRAGYLFFEGAPPAGSEHAGLATLYAHTTAPLRRLCDRYVLETLAGHGNAKDLAALPDVMDASEARSNAVERAVVDEMEARLLEHRTGDVFTAVVLDHDAHGSHIAIPDPPIRARLHTPTPPPLGAEVQVRLAQADPIGRALQFAAV
jgi:exoribonuclease R